MRKFLVLGVLAAAALVACKKTEPPAPAAPAPAPAAAPAPAPLAVGDVTLGNAIGADKKVVAPLEAFGAHDTIYASVSTTGAGHAKLRALWSFVKGDKTAKVNEESMEFEALGPSWNEFHIQNSKPWPAGDYQVEIFLGDGPAPAASRKFKVQ